MPVPITPTRIDFVAIANSFVQTPDSLRIKITHQIPARPYFQRHTPRAKPITISADGHALGAAVTARPPKDIAVTAVAAFAAPKSTTRDSYLQNDRLDHLSLLQMRIGC
jgi:hypothetical protein